MKQGDDLRVAIARVANGDSLSVAECRQAFDIIMSGDATPAQMGGLLMALRVRGETVDELTGGVQVMRDKMQAIQAPANAIDVVGTGGDGTGTLNISTAIALVTAACGLPVAKHGNTALSSKSGAADVLQELGVNTDVDFPVLERAVQEIGICFMKAPRHHGAMRNVGPTRAELGTRTIFNLLGPMSNPANVRRHLIGVFDVKWIEPMAKALAQLGSERLWVVHGSDGTDELTITGPSEVASLQDGAVTRFQITPEDAGLKPAPLSAILGGTPAENARALTALLDGQASAYRDCVVFGTAAALLIGDVVDDLRAGVARASTAIDDGSAKKILEQLVAITQTVEN